MSLAEDIISIMKEYAERDDEYINPHFLSGVTQHIYDYYQIEDDIVDSWVQDMFGW